MINIKIPTIKITLYDVICYNDGNGFDISDTYWDWGTYFECPLKWEDCHSYCDACMLLFALNIEFVKFKSDWFSPCKVTEFIENNREAFDRFLNEAYREGYRPCDGDRLNADEDKGYYELYMDAMEQLLIGNFSESKYERLFQLLTDGVEIPELKIKKESESEE